MRAIVFREGLAEGTVPDDISAEVARTYPYLLDGRIRVEVIELRLRQQDRMSVAECLSRLLRPEGCYAHIVGGDEMLVCFPGHVVEVRRGDTESIEQAQATGSQFGIPMHQMRFDAMFDHDHPPQDDGERLD